MKRINFLDGFRGIAILLVLLFHAFSCWTGQVPYGNKFAEVFPFKQGFLGVQLFFLISGFVILMSLQKTVYFKDFIFKRWIRLFPVMFIVSILIFITAGLLPERLNGQPRWIDLIPGLTFIQANDIKKILHIDILDLENPFWSLYVEVKFYVVFGILYYWLGSRKAIYGLFFLFLLWLILDSLVGFTPLILVQYLYLLLKNLAVVNYGWFAAGAMAYLYYLNKDKKDLILSIIAGIISACLFYNNAANMLFVFVLFFVFILAVYNENFGDYFDVRFLKFYGYISYPLYLIHESAMIGMINKIRNKTSLIPDFLLPVIPIIFLSIVSYLIAKFLEPLLSNFISEKVKNITFKPALKELDVD